ETRISRSTSSTFRWSSMIRMRFVVLVLTLAVSGITLGLMPMLFPNEHPILALTTTPDTQDGSGPRHGSLVQDWWDKANGDPGFFHRTQRRGSSNVCTAARLSSLSSALRRETATATGLCFECSPHTVAPASAQ